MIEMGLAAEAKLAELLPAFNKAVTDLSKNELRRVLQGLAEYPFHTGTIKLYSEKELETYKLGIDVFNAKFTRVLHEISKSKELENAKESELGQ